MELNELKRRYTRRINRKYNKNKQLLIDSFTEYYGEEYRSKIENRINDTIICHYVPCDMFTNFNMIINNYLANIFDITIKIINKLEIENFIIDSIPCEIKDYKISKKEVKFDFKINDTKLEEILKLVFGNKLIISSSFADMPIMNYPKLGINQRKEYVKSLYMKDVTDKKIKEAIKEIGKYHKLINELVKEITKCYEYSLFITEYSKKQKPTLDLNFVGANSSFVKNNIFTFAFLFRNESSAFCKSYYNIETNDVVNFVFLPLFSCDDIFLIHELNHVVTSDILLLSENDEIIREGLIISSKYKKTENEFFEELINEFTALKILDIFKEKKGMVLANEQRGKLTNPYSEGFYIIDNILNEFEEELKHIRMNGDINKLRCLLGKDSFKKISNYCDRMLKNYIIPEKNYKQNKEYVKKLTRNITKNSHFANLDLETYLEDLKTKGYIINLTEFGKKLVKKNNC